MKFTLSWLRDHLDTEAPPLEILAALNRIGLEVEGVTDRGAALAPFRTARIVAADQHPNADRLRICRVDIGRDTSAGGIGPEGRDLVQVVCGAPNARAGLSVIFAPPGSVIPATGATLKVGSIRGVESQGMLCSLRELGLGEEHDGIAELPDNTTPGQSYANFAGLDDPVIEIAITPNRGDALAVRGVARDLAAAGLGRLRPWLAETVEGRFASPITWRIDFPQACPYVLGRTVRALRNGPSPDWLRERLLAIGLRPISALVDITNFFTFDLGRPLHVFDADRLAGPELVLCRGGGETLRALDGRDYIADPEDCVIADDAGVQSFAGLMGGEAAGVSDSTTSVFIECALFDPVRVALSGRRHAISSDARQRFERGIDPALPVAGLEAATRMILELCGGEASDVVVAGEPPVWQREARLRFERIAGLGGLEVAPDAAVASLEALGFAVRERDEASVLLDVPSWRNDIAMPSVLDAAPGLDPARRLGADAVSSIEAECDLIEEVLRLRGLDAVPAVTLPPPGLVARGAVPLASLTPRQARTAAARRMLAARGLAECVGFSFISRDEAEQFGAIPDSLRLLNPIAADLDQLRPTPLASLVLAAHRNAARGVDALGLFEIGPGFAEMGPGSSQSLIASGLRTGHAPRRPGVGATPATLWDAKADALAVLESLGVPMDALGVAADAPAHYHPGRSGTLRQGPKLVLAHFGDLHPGVLQKLALDGPAAGFELFLDAVPDPKRRRRAAPDLPSFQPLTRDFAFLVGTEVTAEAMLRAARGAERTLITKVSLFDVYEGETVPQGQKSLAIEVVLQPRERSLTDAQIEAVCAKVVAAVGKATGGVLRG
ncbi:phenylalanine--tRNA ligase subunit beta [Lichenicoccus sp.]|uniref:phenylalanine--tRNA ligase subunit beta n=1 Tax=Lichenicoccus sp. TaxID=2781899 RepID=UPI003D116B7A